jgi:ribosome-associated protein
MKMEMEMKEVKINTEFIKLDSFLKWCGAVSQGSEAKMYILDELVKVNNEICVQRGKKVRSGDIVEFDGERYKVI